MLWVYGHYKYFISFNAGTVLIRPNMTLETSDSGVYIDSPRPERVNPCPATPVYHVYMYGFKKTISRLICQ